MQKCKANTNLGTAQDTLLRQNAERGWALAACLISFPVSVGSCWITFHCDDSPETEPEAPEFQHWKVSQSMNETPPHAPVHPCAWSLGDPVHCSAKIYLPALGLFLPTASPALGEFPRYLPRTFLPTWPRIEVKCGLHVAITITVPWGLGNGFPRFTVKEAVKHRSFQAFPS